MDQERDSRHHDGEFEDLYDLYNACNGAMHNGLLDIRKLNELSNEEAEMLDLSRLREIWAHMASGCARCQAIITDLNAARERLRKTLEATDREPTPSADKRGGDRFSK